MTIWYSGKALKLGVEKSGLSRRVIHLQHNGHHDRKNQDGRPALTDKRQGYTDNGNQAHRHPDIDEEVKKQ